MLYLSFVPYFWDDTSITILFTRVIRIHSDQQTDQDRDPDVFGKYINKFQMVSVQIQHLKSTSSWLFKPQLSSKCGRRVEVQSFFVSNFKSYHLDKISTAFVFQPGHSSV